MGTRHIDEGFRQALDQEVRRNLFTNARTLDTPFLRRSVSADEVNKARYGLLYKQSGQIKRMCKQDMDEEWRQKQLARTDIKDGLSTFEYSMAEMNMLPVYYYNIYGVGHNGSDCIDKDDAWTCPHCKRTFQTTLATLPLYCQCCGETTPRGRLVEDGWLKR